MELPETLAGPIENARRWLSRADTFNMATYADNAAVELTTLRSYVEAMPELNVSIDETLTAVRTSGDAGRDRLLLTLRGNRLAEQARQLAFIAIDHLVEALSDSRPSEQGARWGWIGIDPFERGSCLAVAEGAATDAER